MTDFSVRVYKDYLEFAGAHFITYGGGCERLHGHNYRVAVTLEGVLDAHGCVCDFVALKGLVKQVLGELDHRMLLPERNAAITLNVKGDEVEARSQGRRYVFPLADCALLPVDNVTAERLAELIAGRLWQRLGAGAAAPPGVNALAVEVEESPGQSATYRRSALRPGDAPVHHT